MKRKIKRAKRLADEARLRREGKPAKKKPVSAAMKKKIKAAKLMATQKRKIREAKARQKKPGYLK